MNNDYSAIEIIITLIKKEKQLLGKWEKREGHELEEDSSETVGILPTILRISSSRFHITNKYPDRRQRDDETVIGI